MRPLNKIAPRNTYQENDYDVLRRTLTLSVGSYCAYCESPVTSDVPVEHKVPKTWVDSYKTRWANLLPACNSCNSSKGSQPQGGSNQDSAKAKWKASLEKIFWPDAYPAETSGTGINIKENKGDNTLKYFRYVRAPLSQVSLFESGLCRKPAALTHSWATDDLTMVWVLPGEGLGEADLERAKETLRCLNLNSFNRDSPEFNDRRVLNRTRAWEVAERTVGIISTRFNNLALRADAIDLNHARGEWATDAMMGALVDAARHSVRSHGFWSVWLTILRRTVAGNPWTGFPLYARALIESLLLIDPHSTVEPDRSDPRNLKTVLPGTDIARVEAFLWPTL